MKTNWYEHQLTKPGYGQFPYIIFKVGYALFMQIPIHFLKPGQEIDLQKDQLTEIKRREEFSDLEFKYELNSLRVDQLISLKEKYDKAFIKYWSSTGSDFPKFKPVSLETFIMRLRNKDFFEKYGRIQR